MKTMVAVGVLVAAGTLAACSSMESTVVLPELRLQVVDEAGRPLGGITAWYGAEGEVYRSPLFGFLPRIDGYIGARFLVRQVLSASESGELVIPRRELRLGKTEHFLYETIFLNAKVEWADASARITREVMEDGCREGSALCPEDGEIQAIDVANSAWLTRSDRARALRQADPGHRVVRLMVVQPDRVEAFRESGAPETIFVSHVVGSDRGKPEAIRVEIPKS